MESASAHFLLLNLTMKTVSNALLDSGKGCRTQSSSLRDSKSTCGKRTSRQTPILEHLPSVVSPSLSCRLGIRASTRVAQQSVARSPSHLTTLSLNRPITPIKGLIRDICIRLMLRQPLLLFA